MIRRSILRAVAIGAACMLCATSAMAAKGKAKPKEEQAPDVRTLQWNLRDHYTFSPDPYEMFYGADNGQWALMLKDAGTLLDKVDASVTFADGKTVDAASLGVGLTTRHALTAELGEGIEYLVDQPAKDGISMRHSITVHKTHPFYVVRLSVKNEGKTPIEISKISTMIIAPGSLKQLGAQSAGYRRYVMEGPCAVYSKDAAPYTVFLQSADGKIDMGFGSLSNGQAYTSVDLQPFSGAWQGNITSTFDPAVKLAPGESLQGDPAWICFTIPSPADIDLYYAYAHNNFPKPTDPKSVPAAWVTVPDGGSLSDLQSARADWSGLEAALVPVTWEGRPGSRDGASPEWPREMRSVASQLHQQNGKAGITIDPLAITDGKPEWTAKSDDGVEWLNPTNADAMSFGAEQLKKVVGWGFDFYVVAPSRIPNEVLKHFNITRARANAAAFDMTLKATGGAPVFAASKGAIGGERDEWLEAAASTARLSEYSIVTGPVRFDASKGKDISEETATAMALCGSPIEVVGNPSGSARKAVETAAGKRDFFPRPLDLASPAPKLWQVETMPDGKPTSLTINIVSFDGARASTPEDEKTLSGTPIKIEKVKAAGFAGSLPSDNGPGKPARAKRK